MNLAAGIAMILLSGAMLVKYRPRSIQGKRLCGLTLLAGIVCCLISDGGPALLLVFRIGALVLLASSSLVWLHREHRRRVRLARRLRHCHRCGRMPWKNGQECPKGGHQRRVCA